MPPRPPAIMVHMISKRTFNAVGGRECAANGGNGAGNPETGDAAMRWTLLQSPGRRRIRPVGLPAPPEHGDEEGSACQHQRTSPGGDSGKRTIEGTSGDDGALRRMC